MARPVGSKNKPKVPDDMRAMFEAFMQSMQNSGTEKKTDGKFRPAAVGLKAVVDGKTYDAVAYSYHHQSDNDNPVYMADNESIYVDLGNGYSMGVQKWVSIFPTKRKAK